MPDTTNLQLLAPEDTYGLVIHTGVAGALPADNATPRKLYQGDGTELPIALTAGAAWIGGKRAATIAAGTPVNESFTVSGTFTDGSNPTSFTTLVNTLISGDTGRPIYTAPGDHICYWDLTDHQWILSNGIILLLSSDDVDTPDLVTTWVPVAPATGTPTISVTAATQGAVGSFMIDGQYLYVVQEVIGRVVFWKKLALSPLVDSGT